MKRFSYLMTVFLFCWIASCLAMTWYRHPIAAFAQSIKTIYPTKDWAISDFVVTDAKYGAKAQAGFDNRAAFQAAIDAAYNAGGGVVYIPAGNYEFRSTQTGSRNVRVRRGSDETRKSYNYEYVLQLPAGVQLRGDWANPELNNGKVLGTILEVRVGKDSPNYDGTVESWWNDSQADNALRTTHTSIADRFIEMREGTGVTNLSIWYPEQTIKDIKPYPWTLYQTSGDCATVENVTLVNAYNGFYSAPSELHYVMNSYMTALKTGIEVHICTDIGRIENVRINPKYWADSGLPGSPSLNEITAYTKANGTGFQMHRSDWEYVSYLYVSGYKNGMWIGKEPGYSDAPNAQFTEIHINNCDTGLYVQAVNPYGLLFSNSTFGSNADGIAAYFFNDFTTSTQFNGVDFTGPVVSDGSDGVISFESCTFDKYNEYALKINNGNVLITQSDFKQPVGHVFLGANVNTLKSMNSGYKRKLEIKNNGKTAKVEILTDDKYLFEPITKNIKTNIDVHPRPASNNVLKVDLPRSVGFNNDAPTEDVSAKLQDALNAVKASGGGTVYLSAGRYLVDNPITIPSGVELRGTWDVQHHTQSGGTAIFTNYSGGAAGEKGSSLIQIESQAGIRGLNILQFNIATGEYNNNNPRPTPFLIQGKGPNVYIINVTIPAGDKGIDLASYNTSGHYVDYFAGVVARAGIWVGGGAEGGFIRNMQFNPHYGTRLPQKGQGYPNVPLMRYVQAHCSQLKFADVKKQTVFNNFVYGSVYGIHFLKDAITGNYPGEMTVVGHGSDGCTYSLFVEDADENTKIIAINSELVNTKIAGQAVRSYVLMGNEINTKKVHPNAKLILYNTAFWGSPTVGGIVNNGIVRYQQANFQRSGATGVDVRGGKAFVYSSFFAQNVYTDADENNAYAKLHETGNSIELTNNYYLSGLKNNSAKPDGIYGSDIVASNLNRLYYPHIFAPSEGYVGKVEKPLRKEICLNGRWDFQPVALPQDYRQGKGIAPELPLPQADKWDKTQIKIPSPWNINSFANRELEGPDHRNYPSYPKEWDGVKMAWMRKSVQIPIDWGGNRLMLHFEAVAGHTQVLVNGKKAAENFDLFLPFDVDITDIVKAGEQAEILVGVRSQALFEDNSTKGRRIVPAGSMWGYHVNGIWQDVYLIAVPQISINNVYIKPLVSQRKLELELTVSNFSGKPAELLLGGDIRKWLNNAGTTVNSAPVPDWKLASTPAVVIPAQKLKLPVGETKTTLSLDIADNTLELWSPEYPNLYGLSLQISTKKSQPVDIKYERFGWREWTFEGTTQLLNGKPYSLKGDSWHFMGVPQLTRRYAYAWFKALKDANANAVRPHAQIYPQFYFDVADEMGICILAETANWASDGGPKMDSPTFWENSKDHLRRMVVRDRNHPSVFGWSVSNENKPVILHVFNKPEWMDYQKQAWRDWVAIVREYDTTRPWISSDGEEDGEGILPSTIGHYGDENSLKNWAALGKPWGVGETSMAYYGTPEQVAKFNGERAYESMEGRMEGLAYECYRLIRQQREAGASYSSVFNIAWYALQPLPFGKRNLTATPSLDDGIWFGEYVENQTGIQPERIGAYCSTFNPGYDPTLPLYRTWPMFDAIKAANEGNSPAWSQWAALPVKTLIAKLDKPAKQYSEITFFGASDSRVKQIFENQAVALVHGGKVQTNRVQTNSKKLIIIDGTYTLTEAERKAIKQQTDNGADIWLWSPKPETAASYASFLPQPLRLEERKASSFIPEHKSWLKNTVNSDFYFSEIQTENASEYVIAGMLADEGEILLRACKTNWRRWNKRPEELKTAAVLRSENEASTHDAVFIKYHAGNYTLYISTLDDFTTSEKGYKTLRKILHSAGIASTESNDSSADIKLIDNDGNILLNKLLINVIDNRRYYNLWVYSPRPLDDLLIEPDMPKLEIVTEERIEIRLNNKRLQSLKDLPLKQGWNKFDITVPNNSAAAAKPVRFSSSNRPEYIKVLQTALYR